MSLAQNRKKARPSSRPIFAARPRVEDLESRVVPATLIEEFAPGGLVNYATVLRQRPFAEIEGAATHDGQSGLAKQDGFEWIIRGNQANPLVQQGQVISTWVNFAGVAAGRAYFGFGARPNPVDATGLTRLADGGALSVVLAPNTNQFILQANPGFNHPGISGATPGAATLGAVSQTYEADKWYRVQVEWAVGGGITARLYDSDGVSLLNTVTGSSTLYTQGGIAFRSFGRPAASPDAPSTDTVYFDTVAVAPLGTSAEEMAAAGGGIDPGGVLPPDQQPPGVRYVSTVGGALVPWLYQSVSGSNLDVLLRSYSGPATAQLLGPTSDPNTQVVFSAANDSFNPGTVPIPWGGPFLGGGFQNGLPQESPVLGQYLFRQLPGEDTRLIASADVKHFYTAVGRSSQFLLQGENDIYGTGLNSNRNLFLPAATLDPVAGDLLTIDDFGPRNADGVATFSTSRPYSGGDLLLRARIADIDPAQNPPGTRWFLMGTLFQPNDRDINNNSRWIEVRATVTGSGVSWATLNNPDAPASGTLNFRTIPGLRDFEGIVAVIPTVTAVSPSAGPPATGQVDHIRVTFASPIDPATFTPEDVTDFTGPNGPIAVTAVVPVEGSNSQFDILFAAQTTPGEYTYTLGPSIFNAAGQGMVEPFAGRFAIAGLLVESTSPAGIDLLPGQLDDLVLRFNQPVDPATFTAEDVLLFFGPAGGIAPTVTPVEGSNDREFRLEFDAQFVTGHYVLVLGNEIYTPFGVGLQGDGLPFHVRRFGIEGVRMLSAAPNRTAPGVTSVRVRFNVPVDPAGFTPDLISGLTGPDGSPSVLSVAPVDGTDNTQYDITFASPLTAVGAYSLVIGPGLVDQYGNAQDQNDNLIPNEASGEDAAVVTFAVAAPRVLGTTLTGQILVGTTTARITFDTPIDPATLTPERILLSRSGVPISVTGVAPVEGSDGTAFDVTFAPLSAGGDHTVALADGVQDVYGNAVAPFSAAFGARFITANATAFEDLDINGLPGNATVIASGDDTFGTFNLGTNTFTFYGVTYTGANQLFISSNGLITFGSENASLSNGDWPSSGSVPQPTIAVLWDDWIKSGADAAATGSMVQARVDGDRLIIQWNRVRHFDSAAGGSAAGTATFQAILRLNTGSANGDVILNYPDLVTEDFNAEGLSASVGVKPAGAVAGTDDRLLTISVNGQAPGGTRDGLVRTGQAVLIQSVARDPRVTAATPAGVNVPLGVSSGRLTFNIPLDPATLTPERIVLTRTGAGGGPIAVDTVTPVAGSNNTQFDFTFAAQTTPGSFTLALASGVTDLTGYPVAAFSSTFTVPQTAVISTTLTGTVQQGTTQGRITFNRAIDPSTLTADRILLTQGTTTIPIDTLTPVAGSNNTQFDFTFAALTTPGTHNLALAAGVQDTFGNAAAPFSGAFTVTGPSTYVAEATTFRNLDIVGMKDTIIASGDDTSAQLSLGTNSFRFFGTTYTTLFISSNGLITFGGGVSAPGNSNLTSDPTQATIAALWDDWISTSGNPMVVYRFENDELIVQWNRVQHFSSGTSTVTFQMILSLNTGTTNGDIVFNYVDLDTASASTSNGLSATVGVKRAGSVTASDPDRTLVSFNASSMLVGSGRAIRIRPR